MAQGQRDYRDYRDIMREQYGAGVPWDPWGRSGGQAFNAREAFSQILQSLLEGPRGALQSIGQAVLPSVLPTADRAALGIERGRQMTLQKILELLQWIRSMRNPGVGNPPVDRMINRDTAGLDAIMRLLGSAGPPRA